MKCLLTVMVFLGGCAAIEPEPEPDGGSAFVPGEYVRFHPDGAVAERVVFKDNGSLWSERPATSSIVRSVTVGTYSMSEQTMHITAEVSFPDVPWEPRFSAIEYTFSYFADENQFARGVYSPSDEDGFGVYYTAEFSESLYSDTATVQLSTAEEHAGCSAFDDSCASVWLGDYVETFQSDGLSYKRQLPPWCWGRNVAHSETAFTIDCVDSDGPTSWRWLADGALVDGNAPAFADWTGGRAGVGQMSHVFTRVRDLR